MKKESSRLIIVSCVLVAAILIVTLCILVTGKKSSQIVTKVEEALESKEAKAVYIIRKGCGYCELNESTMNDIKNRYGADFVTVDTADLTSDDQNKIFSMLKIDTSSFGTPYLTIVKDNQVVSNKNGVLPYNELFNYFKDAGIIAQDKDLALKYINYSDYKNIAKSSDKSVVVLASSTCHYCVSLHPVLEELVNKNEGLKINYFYLNVAFGGESGETDYAEFTKSLDWFKDNSDWGTPTTLVIQNGKVVDSLNGYTGYDDFLAFLKKNSIVG